MSKLPAWDSELLNFDFARPVAAHLAICGNPQDFSLNELEPTPQLTDDFYYVVGTTVNFSPE
jgi:hypothetical protein